MAKLNWHPAFLQAIQLELAQYKDSLEFKYEFQLTSEPLRIDLIIIKKPKNLTINKNFARIFNSWNLCEFKSPDDYLSIKDFFKVYAYANLYAAITPDVDLSAVTLTFVENKYPRKLIHYLTDVRHYTVDETWPGIHVVSGDFLPIQIIESKKLPEAENLWLKSLTNTLEIGAATVILEEGRKWVNKTPLDAYLDILLRANPETFLEVQNMANGTLTFEEVFTRAGIIPRWIERGRKEGIEKGIEKGIVQGEEKKALEIARKLLDEGWSIEKTAGIARLTVKKVRSLK
jgi:hypothetical protein